MPFLDRDGASIHYEATGAGPLILFTHGFSSSGDAFTANLPAVVDAGFRPVTWDLRGHGATDAGDDPSAYTVPLALGDMAALLDVEGATDAVLAGHSLGGYLSLSFLIAHPELSLIHI